MSEKGLHHAIISFIDTFEDIPHPYLTLRDLYDGVLLWKLMQKIGKIDTSQPNFSEQPSGFASALANLKIIIAALDRFYHDHGKRMWSKEEVDVIQIAKNKNE